MLLKENKESFYLTLQTYPDAISFHYIKKFRNINLMSFRIVILRQSLGLD